MNRTTLYSRTLLCLLSAALISPPLLLTSFSHQTYARAGRGGSIGSRGSRTYSPHAYTRTAPSGGQAFQRTITRPPEATPPKFNTAPTPTTPPPLANPAPAPSQGGGFLKGVAGGVAGAAAYDMLAGHHQGNAQTPANNTSANPDQNMNDKGGTGQTAPNPPPPTQPQEQKGHSNYLLWIIVLGLLVWFGIRYFRKNPLSNANQNGSQNSAAHETNPIKEYIKETNIQPAPADYTVFQQRLVEVQEAWSRQDLASLQKISTPEMLSYFNEQLTDLATKGLKNTVSNVQFQQGDLSESWTEGTRQYATVAMRYSLIDVTTDNNGQVVEGNPDQPKTVTELWTFVRSIDHNWWLLSAIQQQN